MTTQQELESVINALSRTISELREMKAKLAKSEADNADNLDIKKNLALRINELQKELETVQQNHAKEMESEKSRTEHYVRSFSSMMMFATPHPITTFDGVKFNPSQVFISSKYRCGPAYEDQHFIRLPAMGLSFLLNHYEVSQWKKPFPIIYESIAHKIGQDTGDYVRTQVLTALKERLR